MKAITIILVCVFFTSCITVKRIEKNCDKFAKVCITETVTKMEYRDTTIYKDRIIKVQLPNDTIRITDTVRVINDRCYLPMRHKQFGVVWVSASVVNSILNVSAGLVDSTILIPVHDTIFIKDAVSNTTTDNTVVLPPEKYIPTIYQVAFWLVVFQLIVLTLFLLGKFGVIKNVFGWLRR